MCYIDSAGLVMVVHRVLAHAIEEVPVQVSAIEFPRYPAGSRQHQKVVKHRGTGVTQCEADIETKLYSHSMSTNISCVTLGMSTRLFGHT